MTAILSVLAIVLFLASAPARAEADSLMEDFPEIVTMLHLYAASDGRTYIEEMKVPPAHTPSDLMLYFDSKVERFRIATMPDGKFSDFHYADAKKLLIYLQGTQILTTGDGKEYALKPGMAALAEDWTGKGHTFHCVAKTKKKVCLMLEVTISANDRTLPLRDPPAAKK